MLLSTEKCWTNSKGRSNSNYIVPKGVVLFREFPRYARLETNLAMYTWLGSSCAKRGNSRNNTTPFIVCLDLRYNINVIHLGKSSQPKSKGIKQNLNMIFLDNIKYKCFCINWLVFQKKILDIILNWNYFYKICYSEF